MSPLPTIHPLSELPQPRGPNGECMCNWCRHWHPILIRVEAQLDAPTKVLFHEYVSHIEQSDADGDVSGAKLSGDWPGWEFMKALKDWDRETQQPVITLASL